GESLGRYARELAPDANRLDAMEERLAQLARLKRKYAGTVEDLIRRREELTAELKGIESGGEIRAELEAAAEAARRAAAEWAGRLSVERRRVARDLCRALVAELEALAFTGARLEVRFAETEDRALGPEGWSRPSPPTTPWSATGWRTGVPSPRYAPWPRANGRRSWRGCWAASA